MLQRTNRETVGFFQDSERLSLPYVNSALIPPHTTCLSGSQAHSLLPDSDFQFSCNSFTNLGHLMPCNLVLGTMRQLLLKCFLS